MFLWRNKPTYLPINIHATLLDHLESVDINIPIFLDNELVDLLLYGSPNFKSNQNNKILSSSISFIIKSERLSGLLFKRN